MDNCGMHLLHLPILLVTVLLAIPVSFLNAAVSWQDDYAALLKKYATSSGVRYAELKANASDLAALQRVVDGIAAAPASNANTPEQLAFHLNAYNAWILHEALKKYPTKKVPDALFTFFTGKRITVAGETMSFNRLEKEIIRPRFNEPRIHFALNCASRSCPPLSNRPFAANDLDRHLDAITRSFINSPNGVRPTKGGAEVSMIFDWYKEDFASAGGVVAFINKYRASPLPQDARLSYQKYDWSINEAK